MGLDDAHLDDGEEDRVDDVHLTFRVAGELYAIGVVWVTEIVRLPQIHPVPGLPRGLRGVINLRGRVVPVVDIRTRLGLEALRIDDRVVVIVLEVDEERVGLMVEEVAEVADLPLRDVQPPWRGQGTSSRGPSLVTGLVRRGPHTCIVLDVARLLAMDEHDIDPGASPLHPPKTQEEREVTP